MTPNVSGPEGPKGPNYLQTATNITNNNYYYTVPDSYYQDKVNLSQQQKPDNRPIIIIYNAAANQVHAQANELQDNLIGKRNTAGLTQDEQLRQVFRESQAICDALTYGGSFPGENPAQQDESPLANYRGLQNMTNDAIRDAMAPLPADTGNAKQSEDPRDPESKAAQNFQKGIDKNAKSKTKSVGLSDPSENQVRKIQQAAIAIHEAIDGPGTDDKTLFEMLEGLSPEERAYLEVAYANMYGNGDPSTLREDLRGDLSGADEEKAISLMNQAALKDPMSAAIALHEAMDGAGTDEKTVRFIMDNSPPEFLREVQDNYDAMFNEDKNNPGKLRRDIQGDFSRWESPFSSAATWGTTAAAATALYTGGGSNPISWGATAIAAGIGTAAGFIKGLIFDDNEEDRTKIMTKLNRSILDDSGK